MRPAPAGWSSRTRHPGRVSATRARVRSQTSRLISDGFGDLLPDEPTKRDAQIESLQAALARERDARREDQFVGIVILVALFDIVFFSVMPSFGWPSARTNGSGQIMRYEHRTT